MSDTANNLVTLAAILRSRRRALRLTQEDVGDLCNVQRQTIGRLENADPTVSLGTAMTVADVLGIDLSLSTDDTR
jgi:transcriptional regulator with XRE-family HTH domain